MSNRTGNWRLGRIEIVEVVAPSPMTLPKIAFGNDGIEAFDSIITESWRWTCGGPTAGDVAPAAPTVGQTGGRRVSGGRPGCPAGLVAVRAGCNSSEREITIVV